jgi:hypothetical protein
LPNRSRPEATRDAVCGAGGVAITEDILAIAFDCVNKRLYMEPYVFFWLRITWKGKELVAACYITARKKTAGRITSRFMLLLLCVMVASSSSGILLALV